MRRDKIVRVSMLTLYDVEHTTIEKYVCLCNKSNRNREADESKMSIVRLLSKIRNIAYMMKKVGSILGYYKY